MAIKICCCSQDGTNGLTRVQFNSINVSIDEKGPIRRSNDDWPSQRTSQTIVDVERLFEARQCDMAEAAETCSFLPSLCPSIELYYGMTRMTNGWPRTPSHHTGAHFSHPSAPSRRLLSSFLFVLFEEEEEEIAIDSWFNGSRNEASMPWCTMHIGGMDKNRNPYRTVPDVETAAN